MSNPLQRLIRGFESFRAAHFEGDFLEVGIGRIAREAATGLGGAGKRHHVDVHVLAERFADIRPAAGQHVEHAGRDAGLHGEFRDAQLKAYPGKPVPQNSWHISIEADGAVVQMAPLTSGCWHAGSSTARKIPGVGWANRTSVGIELIGHGKEFPSAQVEIACGVWRALVKAYGIPREHAMITHQSIDPTRRSDPGPVWMKQHAPQVLAYAYA